MENQTFFLIFVAGICTLSVAFGMNNDVTVPKKSHKPDGQQKKVVDANELKKIYLQRLEIQTREKKQSNKHTNQVLS